MTAKQLKEVLAKAAISGRDAAKLLELDERDMRRYVAGDLPIPRVVEYALLWISHQSPERES